MAGLSKHDLTEYEALTVLNPQIEDSQVASFIEKMKKVAADNGAKHIQFINLGLKKIAWERDGHNKGIYLEHKFAADNTFVKEYERILKIDESVLLRQTHRIRKGVNPDSVTELEDQLKPKAAPAPSAPTFQPRNDA